MKHIGWRDRLFKSTRGKILELLRTRECTVNELADALHLTDNAVRAHLASLERDRLVVQSGMLVDVIGDRIIRPYGRSQEQGQLMLPNRIAGPIFYSRFRPGIRQVLKSERCLVEMGRLLGITDVKLDVVGTVKR